MSVKRVVQPPCPPSLCIQPACTTFSKAGLACRRVRGEHLIACLPADLAAVDRDERTAHGQQAAGRRGAILVKLRDHDLAVQLIDRHAQLALQHHRQFALACAGLLALDHLVGVERKVGDGGDHGEAAVALRHVGEQCEPLVRLGRGRRELFPQPTGRLDRDASAPLDEHLLHLLRSCEVDGPFCLRVQ